MGTVGDGTTSDDAYYLQWSEFQNRAYDLLTAANGGQNVTGGPQMVDKVSQVHVLSKSRK